MVTVVEMLKAPQHAVGTFQSRKHVGPLMSERIGHLVLLFQCGDVSEPLPHEALQAVLYFLRHQPFHALADGVERRCHVINRLDGHPLAVVVDERGQVVADAFDGQRAGEQT